MLDVEEKATYERCTCVDASRQWDTTTGMLLVCACISYAVVLWKVCWDALLTLTRQAHFASSSRTLPSARKNDRESQIQRAIFTASLVASQSNGIRLVALFGPRRERLLNPGV
jgi:hypothetical protein